jgi:transcriptional regulator, gntR family with lacI sensor
MIQTANKADELYRQLREEIGSRKSGERFWTIREIMSRYALSQSVVDRTLSRLRLEGLLVATRGKGLFIGAETKNEPMPEGQYLLMLPRWFSCDISVLNQTATALNAREGRPRIRVENFDFETTVPRNLDGRLRKSAGMVILPASGDFTKADYDTLFHYGEIGPTMLLGRYFDCFGVGSVMLDDGYAAALALHHLIENGHRRIGLLLSEPHNKTILDRVRGVENYARLHDIELDLIDCEIASGEIALAKTYDKFSEVIRKGFRFTALLGVSGESTLGAVNACRNHHISIPEELSVVTIADEELTRTGCPPIDTVGSDIGGQLTLALDLLRQSEMPPGSHYLRPELLRRGSVVSYSSQGDLR